MSSSKISTPVVCHPKYLGLVDNQQCLGVLRLCRLRGCFRRVFRIPVRLCYAFSQSCIKIRYIFLGDPLGKCFETGGVGRLEPRLNAIRPNYGSKVRKVIVVILHYVNWFFLSEISPCVSSRPLRKVSEIQVM
jgi:hypothetical protein